MKTYSLEDLTDKYIGKKGNKKRDEFENELQLDLLGKVIWEGWTVQDFINELEPTFNMIMNNKSWQKPFKTKKELKEWCKSNQPYYKKHIPEVYSYFMKKLK